MDTPVDVTMDVTCPICGVGVPAHLAETPDSRGLTITFNTAYLDEHIAMHRACTCVWSRVGFRTHNPACTVHG